MKYSPILAPQTTCSLILSILMSKYVSYDLTIQSVLLLCHIATYSMCGFHGSGWSMITLK